MATRKPALQSDRDLLAQWAGEELRAAAQSGAAAATHRARSAFYLELLRYDQLPAQPATPDRPDPARDGEI